MDATAVAESMRGSIGTLAIEWLPDPPTSKSTTHRRHSPDFTSFTDDERGELCGLAEAARAHAAKERS